MSFYRTPASSQSSACSLFYWLGAVANSKSISAKERKRGWMWIFLSVNPDDICVSIADSVPLTHAAAWLFFAALSLSHLARVWAWSMPSFLRANLSSQTTTPNKNTHVDLMKKKKSRLTDVSFAHQPCCLWAPQIIKYLRLLQFLELNN